MAHNMEPLTVYNLRLKSFRSSEYLMKFQVKDFLLHN